MTSPQPPADLDRREPNLFRLNPGDALHRFHPKDKAPMYFDRSDAGRLNAPDGSYGVLDAAQRLRGAFAETFLRSPGRQLIDPGLMARKAYVQLAVLMPMTLIDFDGPGLAILGATAEVTHGPLPYDLPQAWSAALKAHPVRAQGIAYGARHDPHEVCFALFEGAPGAVQTIDETSTAAGSGPLRTPTRWDGRRRDPAPKAPRPPLRYCRTEGSVLKSLGGRNSFRQDQNEGGLSCIGCRNCIANSG